MSKLATVREQIKLRRDDAAFWQRHYEVDWQQTKSTNSQRCSLYYKGVCCGYDVALEELLVLEKA